MCNLYKINVIIIIIIIIIIINKKCLQIFVWEPEEKR
jgi:hypothetical protein